MQANFPGIAGWNGAIGLGHLASRDLARWKVGLPPALLPGKWKGPPGAVGQPAGEPLGGYYSGSATVVMASSITSPIARRHERESSPRSQFQDKW